MKEIELQEINEADSGDEGEEGNANNTTKPATSSNLYPRLDGGDEQPMPTLSVSRNPNEKATKVKFQNQVEGESREETKTRNPSTSFRPDQLRQ